MGTHTGTCGDVLHTYIHTALGTAVRFQLTHQPELNVTVFGSATGVPETASVAPVETFTAYIESVVRAESPPKKPAPRR